MTPVSLKEKDFQEGRGGSERGRDLWDGVLRESCRRGGFVSVCGTPERGPGTYVGHEWTCVKCNYGPVCLKEVYSNRDDRGVHYPMC